MPQLPDPLDLLAEGIPLTLLIDLLGPTAPNSEEILAAEPGDASWVPRVTSAA
jgi:hypothetical protein